MVRGPSPGRRPRSVRPSAPVDRRIESSSSGAASGWGLFLVDRLASRWGTDEAGYWFELDGSRKARR